MLELPSLITIMHSFSHVLEIVKLASLQFVVFTTSVPETTVTPHPLPIISMLEEIINGIGKENIPGPINSFLIFPLLASTISNFS